MYNDLDDGKYEKTIYVKTWTGRTITVVFSPEIVTRTVKKEIEGKTGIPTDHQQLTSEGRVLTDNASMREIGLSEGRTIEITAKLLGGMKNKSLSPKPMDTEREKKRKESEPCIDVIGLEDENPVTNPDDEFSEARRWMRETMKDLRQRTDDVSELERSVSTMQWDMTEVKNTLKTVTSSLDKMTEVQATRDKKLDDLLASLSTSFVEKEKKTEEKLKVWKEAWVNRSSVSTKRLSSVERGSGGCWTHPNWGIPGRMGSHPNGPEGSDTWLQTRSKRTGSEKNCSKDIKWNWNERKALNRLPCYPTHLCLRGVPRQKDKRQIRQVGKHAKISIGRKFEKKRLRYIKFAINKSTGIQLHWIKLNLEKRSVFVYGQLAARVENNGFLKYYKYESVEHEAQKLMDKWLTKN